MTVTNPDEANPSHQVRTRLAWRRTVLATGVVALLAGRLAAQRPPIMAAILASGAAVSWLLVLAAATLRVRALSQPQDSVVRRAAALVAIATVGYAILGAFVVVVPYG